MSENKQPCDTCEHNPEYNPQPNTDRPIAILTDSGIGGGLAGAAIGGLLGHRVGGVFGAVVGATAGGLVGNGTAVRINRVVESIENSANTVSDTVNHNVNSVGTALKDTIEEVKPFVGTANTVAQGVNYGISNVNSVVDTLRDTVVEVKPSFVGTAYTVAQGISSSVNSINSVVNTLKDTVDEVKPSVVNVVDTVVNTVKDTIEQIKPPANSDEEIIEDSDPVAPALTTPTHPESDNIQSTVNTVKDNIEEIKPSTKCDRDIEDADTGVNLWEDNSELDQSVVTPALTTPAHPEFEIQSTVNTVKDNIEEIKPTKCDRDIEDTDIGVNLWEDNSELDDVVIPLTTPAHLENIQSVNTVKDNIEEINLSANSDRDSIADAENSQLHQESLVIETPLTTPAHPEFENIQSTTEVETTQQEMVIPALTTPAHPVNNIVQSELKNKSTPEVETNPRSQRIEFIKGISPIVGAVIGAVAFISLGSISGFSPIPNSRLTSARSRTAIPASEPSASTPADGWIFIGNINKTSPASGKPLLKGSQSTDSSVVPSVGALVTVNFDPGVTLRDNAPQKPNYSYKEQKALDVVKPAEKLKILQVELIPSPQTNKSVTSVWAKVDRCGKNCD
ncbi:MAG: hypothetical protein WBA41_18050 [Rivularia sp. (in: cyanobacteria)]